MLVYRDTFCQNYYLKRYASPDRLEKLTEARRHLADSRLIRGFQHVIRLEHTRAFACLSRASTIINPGTPWLVRFTLEDIQEACERHAEYRLHKMTETQKRVMGVRPALLEVISHDEPMDV